MKTTHSSLALAIAAALTLAACGGGGGGGNVRPTTPSTPPPPPPPPTTPPPTTGNSLEFCTAEGALNRGGKAPCITATASYRGIEDNLTVGTRQYQARALGYDGTGVKVGLLDDQRYAYAPIDSKVAHYQDYTGTAQDPSVGKSGHGAIMGALIAGDPGSNNFHGGMAPGASLYWGRVCSNDTCSTSWASAALQDMIGRGVRLFSVSLSGQADALNTSDIAPIYARDYGRWLLQGDALMVASTGNAGYIYPGFPAVLPVHDAQFSRNIIAAANLNLDSSGQPSGLNPTSNRCGTAYQWCISAPGTNLITPLPGTQWQQAATGTSNAAAIVSGTAALVWQAFPWMSAYNVQQTILTTAIDIGQPGVDTTYGWGLVNAGKAVKGPAKFVTDFDANVSGMAWFLNDIDGVGGLVKRGAGQLMLAGANSYGGQTVVEQGVLGVNGSLSAPVLVKAGATFQSYGARVGAYTAQDKAVTAVQIGKGLQVDGAAAIDGTLQLLAEPKGYTVQSNERIIGAASITGTFDEVTYGSGLYYTATLAYTLTAVNATLTRTSASAAASAAGLSPAAVTVGSRLDTAFGSSPTPASSAFNRLASVTSTAAAAAELESLSGEIQGTARTLGILDAVQQGDRVADRIQDLRSDESGGVWFQVNNADSDLRQGHFADAHLQSHGFMGGVDRRFDNGGALGVALSKTRAEGQLDGLAGSLEADRTGLALYGRMQAGGVALAAVVGHDQVDAETRRAAVLGGDAEAVAGDRKDRVLHGRIEAGIPLGKITPFVAVGAIRHAQGAFSETGAAGLGLAAAKDTHSVSFADFGVRLGQTFDRCQWGGILALRRVLSGEDAGYTASFAGVPEGSFRVAGQPLSINSQRAGLQGRCEVAGKLSAYGDVGIEFTDGSRRAVQGAIGLRYGF